MGLTAGTKLGPYEIQSLIGAGGMGEVYRARDTRLQRDVAIKVLPSSLAHDQERLRRFEQEARAVAALNHPNLLTVFDVGTAPIAQEGADGSAASSGTTTAKESPYIVSELLEGATLREKLSARCAARAEGFGLCGANCARVGGGTRTRNRASRFETGKYFYNE